MPDDFDFEVASPDQLARFTLDDDIRTPGGTKPITLLVRHAGDGNEPWVRASQKAKFQDLSKEAATALADELAAKHVIVGWENAHDAQGQPIRYTPALGLKLLAKLRASKRSQQLARLAGFCAAETNFTAKLIDPVELGNG